MSEAPGPRHIPFPVSFRDVEEGDMGFVVKTWLQSYHEGARQISSVPFHRYKREQRAVIRDCLARGECVVACDPDDATHLHGFASGWDDLGVGVLHYVYVAQTRRRVGLARELVRQLGIACGRSMRVYTHRTAVCEYSKNGASEAFTAKLGLRYDPFSLVRMIYASDAAVRSEGVASADRDGGQQASNAPPRRPTG